MEAFCDVRSAGNIRQMGRAARSGETSEDLR